MLTTHESNIGQLKACVKAYSEVWIHGDGNIFPVYAFNPNEPDAQDHSKNHAENYNRGFEQCSYRVKINNSNMPKSKAELDRLLQAAKAQDETLRAAANVNKSKITNVVVSDNDFQDVAEPAGEIDYSKYVRNK